MDAKDDTDKSKDFKFTVRIRGEESEDELPSTKIILRSEPIRQFLREVVPELARFGTLKAS